MFTATSNPQRRRNISDGEVREKTGLGWFEWQTALDTSVEDNRRLRTIIAYLKDKPGLNQFWAQVVATHYLLERVS